MLISSMGLLALIRLAAIDHRFLITTEGPKSSREIKRLFVFSIR